MTTTVVNPYSDLPEYSFWKNAVAAKHTDVDPVLATSFEITKHDKVATAGSCFAQHISNALMERRFNYLITESGPSSAAAKNENFGVFSARFGNIYTVRQLLQLFKRAYGTFEPKRPLWVRTNGNVLDPFRPRIQTDGFESPEHLAMDRSAHLSAVREMFEACDVFVFTLGLTEAWMSTEDGAVVPFAPGTVGIHDPLYRFENFAVPSMIADLTKFVTDLRYVNSDVRIILTVSPVPLVATYEERHVLVSSIYSKSALRVVADAVSRTMPSVEYFPSYEIIVGPQAGSRFFASDLRTVTQEGVATVMDIFTRHYLTDGTRPNTSLAIAQNPSDATNIETEYDIVCDEEILES